jgi:hypothetical protein
MAHYAAQQQFTDTIRRSARTTRTPIQRAMIVASAAAIEAVLILAVVLSTVGAGATPAGPGPRLPAPAAWTR